MQLSVFVGVALRQITDHSVPTSLTNEAVLRIHKFETIRRTLRSSFVTACVLATLGGVRMPGRAATVDGAARYVVVAPGAIPTPDPGGTSPPGDISDTQAYVTYHSRVGYKVLAPEGWSRNVAGSNVSFVSNYNGESVTVAPKSDPLGSVRRLFAGVANVRTSNARVGNVATTLIRFSSRSKSDAVTGRSIELDNASYVFKRGSQQAILNLWAPKGSDNVDQWQKIVRSFTWK